MHIFIPIEEVCFIVGYIKNESELEKKKGLEIQQEGRQQKHWQRKQTKLASAF